MCVSSISLRYDENALAFDPIDLSFYDPKAASSVPVHALAFTSTYS
jgi:hypothetical protein